MLLKVKKQIEETMEVKTPAYYKDIIGNIHYINEEGRLITVRTKMVNIWEPKDGYTYNQQIESLANSAKSCTKEEFDKAYAEAISHFESVIGVEI